jgi:hypothetical protein
MRRVLVALLIFSSAIALAGGAGPKPGPKPPPPPAPAPAPTPQAVTPPAAAPTSSGVGVSVSSQGKKVKSYDFTAIGIQGKVLTPQLLYLLDRIKVELEKNVLLKRSFMPELVRSVDEEGL